MNAGTDYRIAIVKLPVASLLMIDMRWVLDFREALATVLPCVALDSNLTDPTHSLINASSWHGLLPMRGCLWLM